MSRAVAKHLRVDYDYFRNQADPFNLNDEIANLRTLLVEVREGIEDASADQILQYSDLVQGALLREYLIELNMDEDEAIRVAERSTKVVMNSYNAIWKRNARITPKDALDIAKTVEMISRVSERYKKMIDGIALDVVYDDRMAELLSKFVVNVVMKFIPVSARKPLAAACFDFIPNMQKELGPTVIDVEPIEAQAEEAEIGDLDLSFEDMEFEAAT